MFLLFYDDDYYYNILLTLSQADTLPDFVYSLYM